MNEILDINNIHGYLDKETGTAYLNAEDVARGFGFTENKGGVEYVKWRRVNTYLHEFGFSPDVAKDSFLLKTWCTGWDSRPAMRWPRDSRQCWQTKSSRPSGSTAPT